jgi:hypothetical protein
MITAVVFNGEDVKEYRLPTADEIRLADEADMELAQVYTEIPFGLPDEPIVEDAKRNTWCVQYGVDSLEEAIYPAAAASFGNLRQTYSKRCWCHAGGGLSGRLPARERLRFGRPFGARRE